MRKGSYMATKLLTESWNHRAIFRSGHFFVITFYNTYVISSQYVFGYQFKP